MKKFAFSILLLLLICEVTTAQDTSELERRNGFKNIKLGSPVDSVKGAEFVKEIKEKNEFPAKLYDVDNPDYKKIGEVNVRKIQLRTYKYLIYQIEVITDKDTRLMKGMIKSFGDPKYNAVSETYHWTTDKLSLTFKNHSKNEIKLTYRDTFRC